MASPILPPLTDSVPVTSPADPIPASVRPVAGANRLPTIDMVRGFALLGILMMNIMGFALPHPTIAARLYNLPPESLDFRVLEVVSTVFEGTMRALFSMLFGAGVLLFTAKPEDRTNGYTLADFYYRRLLWLVLFGVINAYVLLWPGDILYTYGLGGLLLFPFRRLKPGLLLLAAGFCFLVSFGKGFWHSVERQHTRTAYRAAVRLDKQKKPLTDEQKAAKTAWQVIEKETKVDPKQEAEFDRKMRAGYGTVFTLMLPFNSRIQSVEFYEEYLWDVLVMMFLGMALFNWRFFSGLWTTRSYAVSLLVGYGIGLPLGYLAFWELVAQFHDPGAVIDVNAFPFQSLYHIRRASTAVGHASLLLLVYRSGLVPGLMRGLARVGQMAFTNYLMQTVICTLIFYGYGLGYFDKLPFHQLYYVVAGVWVFQFVFSSVWLRYFRFGPLEWGWRSLTYWQRQPLRRRV